MIIHDLKPAQAFSFGETLLSLKKIVENWISSRLEALRFCNDFPAEHLQW